MVEIGLKAKGNANADKSDAIAGAAAVAFHGPENRLAWFIMHGATWLAIAIAPWLKDS